MLKIIRNNPEVLFLCSVLFYWISSSMLNPLAIALFIISLIMIFAKANKLSMIIGSLFGFINVYLILALISEFSEFPEINSQAILMIFVGAIYIAFNLYTSVMLIIKNVPSNGKIQTVV